jgi:hypothetical protein
LDRREIHARQWLFIVKTQDVFRSESGLQVQPFGFRQPSVQWPKPCWEVGRD